MPSIGEILSGAARVFCALIGLSLTITAPWVTTNIIRHHNAVNVDTVCTVVNIGPEECNPHHSGQGYWLECFHPITMAFNTSICMGYHNNDNNETLTTMDIWHQKGAVGDWLVGNKQPCLVNTEICLLAEDLEYFSDTSRIILSTLATLAGLTCFIGSIWTLVKIGLIYGSCCCSSPSSKDERRALLL